MSVSKVSDLESTKVAVLNNYVTLDSLGDGFCHLDIEVLKKKTILIQNKLHG